MGFTDAFKRKHEENDADALMASASEGASEGTGAPGFSGIRFVDGAFSKAVAMGASDIHFEPREHVMHVRVRVDGHFMELASAEESQKAAIVARIKILAGLKIDETRLPQDGKANFKDGTTGKEVDMRVSVIPTIYGEKIVVRLLKKEAESLDLRSIGMLPMNMVKIKGHLKSSYGLILVV